jgi:hypothetical protein
MRTIALISFLVLSSLYAEEEVTTTTTTTETESTTTTSTSAIPAETGGSVIGSVELRPSYQSQIGEFHTENLAELGYKFDPDTFASYRQEFNTNLYQPSKVSEGVDATAMDGYLRGGVANIWRADDLSLSWEGRAYVPTNEIKRDQGMLTAIRNYAILNYQLSPAVGFTIADAPILHVYDRAGANGIANPIFENKLDVGPSFAFTDRLKLFVPLKLSNLRHRAFANGAVNNDAWVHSLQLYPELFYTASENITLGGAYYTTSLIEPDFGGFTLNEGFKNSVTQLIFIAHL